ncbi:MAG: phytanoyl-CoA dioxygenase family protein [Polyangiaceae bacterium]
MTSVDHMVHLAKRSRDEAMSLLADPEYWSAELARAELPSLRITPSCRPVEPRMGRQLGDSEARRLQSEMCREGYSGALDYIDRDACARLAAVSLALLAEGWSPAFALLFDDAWLIARELGALMRQTVNRDLVLRYEMFIYCIDSTIARARSRGIGPHRDAPTTGFDDSSVGRLPRHCTSWLALSDATVDNGCIVVVPATREADLFAARPGEAWDAPIDVERGLPVEAKVGTALMWGGHVAHWGGVHDRQKARGPRITLTCVASVDPIWGLPELEVPTEIGAPELPSMEARLDMIVALIRGFDPPKEGSALAELFALMGDRTWRSSRS